MWVSSGVVGHHRTPHAAQNSKSVWAVERMAAMEGRKGCMPMQFVMDDP